MEKKDVPQDLSSLGKITKEVCYATDETGKYTTELSRGWDIKISALDTAWQDIKDRVTLARELVLDDKASPILFVMGKGLMCVGIVSAYTGFCKWHVRGHLKTALFNNVSHQ